MLNGFNLCNLLENQCNIFKICWPIIFRRGGKLYIKVARIYNIKIAIAVDVKVFSRWADRRSSLLFP